MRGVLAHPTRRVRAGSQNSDQLLQVFDLVDILRQSRIAHHAGMNSASLGLRQMKGEAVGSKTRREKLRRRTQQGIRARSVARRHNYRSGYRRGSFAKL